MTLRTNFFRIVLFSLMGSAATVYASGESSELSPEALDAAFSAADTAREAATWSDATIVQTGADPLSTLAADADLIFRGRVTSQRYVYGPAGTPFTRTEFSVDGLLKGEQREREFVLLQEGGPSRAGDGRIMLVSSSQHFSVGEEELLFVTRNEGAAQEHRRASVQHRYRVYGDRLYNEDGRGLILEEVSGGTLDRMRFSDDRHPDSRFSTIRVGGRLLHKHFESVRPVTDATPALSSKRSAAGRSYRDSVHVDDFSAAITR